MQSYQLCKRMADRLDEVIDAYVPPVPVIPETRRRYSLRSLGLADKNFNLVTGGDDFDADNDDDAVRNTASLVSEILEGGDAGTETTATETTATKTPPPKKRRGHLTTFVDAVTLAATKF